MLCIVGTPFLSRHLRISGTKKIVDFLEQPTSQKVSRVNDLPHINTATRKGPTNMQTVPPCDISISSTEVHSALK